MFCSVPPCLFINHHRCVHLRSSTQCSLRYDMIRYESDHRSFHPLPGQSQIRHQTSDITAFRSISLRAGTLSTYLHLSPSPKAVKSHAFILTQFQAAASLVPIDSPLQQAPVKRTWLPPNPSPFVLLDPLIAIHVELKKKKLKRKNSTFHSSFPPSPPPFLHPPTQKIKTAQSPISNLQSLLSPRLLSLSFFSPPRTCNWAVYRLCEPRVHRRIVAHEYLIWHNPPPFVVGILFVFFCPRTFPSQPPPPQDSCAPSHYCSRLSRHSCSPF